ncbi:hypothetical protein ACS0TY_022014 [Phlomoides rotata]
MSLRISIGVIAGIGVILLVLAWGLLVLCKQYCPRGTSEQHLLQKVWWIAVSQQRFLPMPGIFLMHPSLEDCRVVRLIASFCWMS